MHQLGYRMKRISYSYLQARAEEARMFQGVLNCAAWVGVRRWCFKTRRVSACIAVWDEAGPNAANGCAL